MVIWAVDVKRDDFTNPLLNNIILSVKIMLLSVIILHYSQVKKEMKKMFKTLTFQVPFMYL